MGSLQDQLLKAGLATPEQLRKARAEQRREQRREPRGRRDAQEGGRTPGRRSPGRGRAAPGTPSTSGAGGAERGKEAAPGSGREGKARHPRAGGAGPRSAPRPGRNEGAGRPPGDVAPGGDASVQTLNLRIRELLDRHALNDRKAEVAFNFTRENVIRRVYVTDEQRRKLAAGELAIVGFRRRHHIVPAAVADEIQALRSIVFVHRAAGAGAGVASDAPVPAPAAAAEDDPYRDFPVPDDLHW